MSAESRTDIKMFRDDDDNRSWWLTGSDLDRARNDGAGSAVSHTSVRGRMHFRRVLAFGERREHQRAIVVHVHQIGYVAHRGAVAYGLPADQRPRRALGRALHTGAGRVREEHRNGRLDGETRSVFFATVRVHCNTQKNRSIRQLIATNNHHDVGDKRLTLFFFIKRLISQKISWFCSLQFLWRLVNRYR